MIAGVAHQILSNWVKPLLERVPIKWSHLIDKDAAQSQRIGACPDRKSRATFSGHALERDEI
jgi:hypothetical protein